MASGKKPSGSTSYDLQPLEEALSNRGLSGIYTRDFIQKLAEDTAKLRSGELSLASIKDNISAPIWLRNPFTNEVNAPNPGLRTYSGHWYNSYLRIAAHGYGRGPDLLIEARQKDGKIGPPDHVFDPTKTCAPVQLTSHTPHQDDQLEQKQQSWAICDDTYRSSNTRTLLQLQITCQHLQSNAPRIDKVVCMGLGGLTRQTGSLNGLDAWFRPYFQHIVALSISEALDDLYTEHPERYGGSTSPVKILAQDPGYSHSDKQILSEHGIAVVEDPHGLLAIDESTFVMSAFPSFPLYEIIADMLPAGPAAVFDASLPGDVSQVDSAMRCNEFAAPRVKRMFQGWQIYEPRWDEQELFEIGQELQLAVDWLPRMMLFFQPSSAEEPSVKVREDVQRRRDACNAMMLSGVRLWGQWLLRSVLG